jgi:hypothetical protein
MLRAFSSASHAACAFLGSAGEKRVAEIVERDTPIRYRAVGVFLQHGVECFAGFAEPIRMHHRHAGV